MTTTEQMIQFKTELLQKHNLTEAHLTRRCKAGRYGEESPLKQFLLEFCSQVKLQAWDYRAAAKVINRSSALIYHYAFYDNKKQQAKLRAVEYRRRSRLKIAA
jgi:hypothetical protein